MLFWAKWGVRAVMEISAMLLKYATFEGVIFIFSFCTTLSQETYILALEHKNIFLEYLDV